MPGELARSAPFQDEEGRINIEPAVAFLKIVPAVLE
jgi:hypothetical protein